MGNSRITTPPPPNYGDIVAGERPTSPPPPPPLPPPPPKRPDGAYSYTRGRGGKKGEYEISIVQEIFQEAENEFANTRHSNNQYYTQEFEDSPPTKRDGAAAAAQDKNKFKGQSSSSPASKPNGPPQKTNNPRGGLTPNPEGTRDTGADRAADTVREGNARNAMRQSNDFSGNKKRSIQGNWPPKNREYEMSVMQEIFMDQENEINTINTLWNREYDTREYMVGDNGGHSSNKTPSNRPKHEKGNARRDMDRGGEKGDQNRP